MHIAILLDMSMDHVIRFFFSPFFVLVQVSENGFAQYIQFGRMTNHDTVFELIIFFRQDFYIRDSFK